MITGWDRFDKLNDKVKHFILGLIITLLVGFIFSLEYGILVGVSAGVFKEVWDEYTYGGFDAKDLIATLLGVVVGTLIISMI